MNTFRYTNPVTSDPALSMRDHFILRVGEEWFLTGTSAPFWTGPNPGVRLLASRDLRHWEPRGWIIDAATLPPGCPYHGRFWAPELHAAHGRYFLTVNSGHEGPEHGSRRMDDHRVFLFRAEQVEGPYKLLTPAGLGRGFKNDASLFTDDDGRSFLYGSGGGLWQAGIDLGTGALHGDFEKILGPADAGNPEWMIGGVEGPFVIRREGFYWMFFSAWTRGYEVGVLRARHPLGPWELCPRDPIFGTRKRRYREKQMREGGYDHVQFADTRDPFVETGHGAIFTGPDGRDWFCCHYFKEGTEVISTDPVLEYADSAPQLGFEPLAFSGGQFSIPGPTSTEQTVTW